MCLRNIFFSFEYNRCDVESRVKLVCFSFFVIRHSSSGEVSLFFVFRYSFFVNSFFVFRHSNWDRISYFDIQNPILTFELGPNFVF